MKFIFKCTLAICCLSLLIGCQSNTPTEAEDRPNIVLILSDDQAWGDYSFMGHEVVQTPNLDRLAAESVVFKRGYVPTAVCRPSLMTLVTGLYPHQHHITGNDPAGGFREARYPREDLLANIDTLAKLPTILGDAGYLSHQSGKWWEGNYSRGGFTNGMTQGRRHGDEGLTIGREGMQPIFDFIDTARTQEKPFFVWYAPFLPHTPHTPPDRLLSKYEAMDLTLPVAKYYAMIEWFDETCGDLVNYLDQNNLRENTLIYYLCDNGWIQKEDKNGFDVRSKQSPMEGGVRTPIMFSWPGQLAPAERTEFVSSIDLFPTILEAAGIQSPGPRPGLNLWANLTTGAPIERDIIFGEGYGHNMIDNAEPEASLAYRWCIQEPWKLILCYDGELEGYGADTHADMRMDPIRLYNIIEDPNEKINLADQHPAVVESLGAAIEAWYPLEKRKVLASSIENE
ncbi:MAG: sulfatase [Saprospiraceae bacterium]|nr:sulfatase [Saprospiraceae bacterium]